MIYLTNLQGSVAIFISHDVSIKSQYKAIIVLFLQTHIIFTINIITNYNLQCYVFLLLFGITCFLKNSWNAATSSGLSSEKYFEYAIKINLKLAIEIRTL